MEPIDLTELTERCYGDYTVGEVFEIGDHLMTEDRIISFASEFDPQIFHTDPEAAKQTVFGGLVASGWHTGSVMMKLLSSTLGPSSLGSPGGESLRFLAPVRPGDRLRLRVTVLDKRVSASNPERGVMRYRTELVNQADVVVLSLEPTMFILRRT